MDKTAFDRRRYARSLTLPGFSDECQRRLLGSKVVIIGAGALGTVAGMYLAASGAGHILTVDFDTVDISNLQRQIAFCEADLGKGKAAVLAGKLRAINSSIVVEHAAALARKENIGELLGNADIVVEASDNPSTKNLVALACGEAGVPCVFGGVSEWNGQATSWRPGEPSYTELFPLPENPCGFTPCSLGGVLGPLPGIIGSVQATETIKILTGIGKPLFRRLLVVDAATMEVSVFSY